MILDLINILKQSLINSDVVVKSITVNDHNSQIGTVISVEKNAINTPAGIDRYTTGASVTLSKGVWVVCGRWTFNSRSGTGTSNRQISIFKGSVRDVSHRVMCGGRNYGILTISTVLTLDEDTVVNISGGCSEAITSGEYDSSDIKAVRIA